MPYVSEEPWLDPPLPEPKGERRTSGAWRCSLAARARGDQLIGTAVPARRWFLVGHRGPWARSAIATPPLSDIARDLDRALGRASARLQLIRRHGRVSGDAPDEEQPVALVDSVSGRVRWDTWREPEDLLRLAATFEDLPEEDPEPIVVVCAHGKKDVCCAIEGRLVTGVLNDVMPDAVWETTHLGGDRFAGNLALLPEGSMYGEVLGSNATDLVMGHVDGTVDLAHWRGRSIWTSPAQVVVAEVVRAGVPLAAVRSAVATPDGADRWVVEVVADGATTTRVVTRTLSPPRRLTCSTETKQAATYHLDD